MGINVSIHDRASLVRSVVVAANDGITTTFAVVAGSLGASLSPKVVLILGFANLFADGLSMATGAYLGVKSEIEFEEKSGQNILLGYKPLKNAADTFFSFVVAGFIPLIAYVFKFDNAFIISALSVCLALMVVGVLRGKYTNKSMVRTAFENLFIGGSAALVAYFVGSLVDKYLI